MSAGNARPTDDGNEPAWVSEVLGFWFGELNADDWFASDHHLDGQIRARFLPVYEELARSEARAAITPRALLAAIIVFDQFPRNMFRNSPRAYATDALARRLARTVVDRQFDRAMADAERMFLYLPFEHSEDRDDQALSVKLFTQVGNEGWVRYALAHKDLIDRFGRFPHRNAVLGRKSTPEELARLQQPMSSF